MQTSDNLPQEKDQETKLANAAVLSTIEEGRAGKKRGASIKKNMQQRIELPMQCNISRLGPNWI